MRSARIAQGMEENGELTEALRSIKNVMDNTSWFRDTPHYWAKESLPLAYAVACVEVVCENSEKAGIVYDKIVKAWSAPGMRVVFDDIASIKPDVIQDDSYLLTTGQTWASLFRCRYSYIEGKGYALSMA